MKYDDKLKKINITCIGFLVFLIYVSYIFLCDFFDFFCFIININQATLLSRIIVVFLVGILLFILLKKIKIYKIKIQPYEIIFFLAIIIFILGFSCYKAIYPDLSYDTLNYHILLQNPGFTKTFSENFVYSGFQMYTFKLSDRLFYLFRIILGYRMGTILNSLIIILVIYQMYKILKYLFEQRINLITKSNKILKYFFMIFNFFTIAFLIVMGHDVIMQISTYMVDLLCIPFILELLYLLLKKLKDKEYQINFYYFAFLSGITFALKMTNVIYLLPILIVFIFLNYKEIKVYKVLICIGIAIISVLPYLSYNYIETGNPVFPYFNGIFKSEFCDGFVTDGRWGGTDFLEKLIWPLSIIFKPEYRTSEIPNMYQILFVISLVSLQVIAIRAIYLLGKKEEQNKSMLLIGFICLVSMYFWCATLGHIRYFALGFILFGIIAVELIVYIAERKHVVIKFATPLLLAAIIVSPVITFKNVKDGREWAWRTYEESEADYNKSQIFNDQKISDIDYDVDLFVLFDSNPLVAYATLIDPDAKIMYVPYLESGRIADVTSYFDNIEKYINDGKNVYGIYQFRNQTLGEHVEILAKYGYTFNNLCWLDDSFGYKDTPALYKIEKGDATFFQAKNGSNNQMIFDTSGDVLVQFKATIGVHYCWESVKNVKLRVQITSKDEETIYDFDILDGEQIDCQIPLLNLKEDFTISFVTIFENPDDFLETIYCIYVYDFKVGVLND